MLLVAISSVCFSASTSINSLKRAGVELYEAEEVLRQIAGKAVDLGVS